MMSDQFTLCGRGAPEASRLLLSRHEVLIVGREVAETNLLRVRQGLGQQGSVGRRPEAGGLIPTRRQDGRAVRTEGQVVHIVAMTGVTRLLDSGQSDLGSVVPAYGEMSPLVIHGEIGHLPFPRP